MKKLTFIVVFAILLSFGFASSAFYARGPGVFIGGYYGFPYYAYPYYPYPYYYVYPYSYSYEPYVYIEPPVYGESQQDYYWYYCKNPEGYYPYVASCPGGWMRVVPAPPQPGKEKETIQ
jgi:hypothetical protein